MNRFRYRKVFMVWKKWIRATKMETARVHLILEGYFSHPPLFRATVCVRNQLRTLESSLFDWDFGGEGISLTMFNQANVGVKFARFLTTISCTNQSFNSKDTWIIIAS